MWYHFLKRLMDIAAASVLLIISTPLILLIAFFIKISSPGPVLADAQVRVGKNSNTFRMYKFRSMIEGASDVLKKDPKFKKLYQEYKKNSFKISTDRDPRITAVGKWIRKSSLDELPQLVNIIKGEMSLVGPRAFHTEELKEQMEKYPQTKKKVETLLKIKPGLTGLWQVEGRSAINFPERVKLDAKYAKEKSIFSDIKILLKTLPAVFKGEGN